MPLIHHPTITFLRCWLELRLGLPRDERGAETVERVILTALFATLALGVGGIIIYKVTEKANQIPVDASELPVYVVPTTTIP